MNENNHKEAIKAQKIKEKQLLRQRTRIYNDMVLRQRINLKKIKNAPKSNFISLININKIYDNKVQAVYDFNLDINEREFIVLVGPSGCGKTTTLRMIAGLEDITYGDLFIDGTFANDLHPKDRDIAMVFQSYALYPHMTVAGNMSFGLRIRKMPTLRVDENNNSILVINKFLINKLSKQANELTKLVKLSRDDQEIADIRLQITELHEKVAFLKHKKVAIYDQKRLPKSEIRERVFNAARILQIEDYLFRKPKALSGGQKQRVALGRAIVRKAKVFLMDEPLSNLDAKLRVAMRSEIIKLHKSLAATTIYVTHDQTEAMTMATRIVVMNKGYIQQIGTPIEIYNKPANLFVATFIGSPSMNLLDVMYHNSVVKFNKGLSLNLGPSIHELVQAFYINELTLSRQQLINIDRNFVERNEYLEKIALLKQTLANNEQPDNKLAGTLTATEEELKYCEESNLDRVRIINIINKLEKLSLTQDIPLILGLRPEDIYQSNRVLTDSEISPIFNLTISVAELLGHEYYVHTEFQGATIVSKIHAKTIVNADDPIDLVFDLSKIHLFDPITEKLIA